MTTYPEDPASIPLRIVLWLACTAGAALALFPASILLFMGALGGVLWIFGLGLVFLGAILVLFGLSLKHLFWRAPVSLMVFGILYLIALVVFWP